MSTTMQSARSDGEYSHTDVDQVVPNTNHTHEQLKHMDSGKEQLKHVDISSSCRLRGWGWILLAICFFIAATLSALLLYFLISPATTPTSTTSVNPKTTGYASTSTDPMNCQEVYSTGGTTSGVYTIYPDGTNAVQVYCEQTIAGGGWTVFQRRMDGKVNFYRGWVDYRQGFGDPSGEYWVGNANLHTLTANQDTQLLVELEHGGETLYATYRDFWVLSEVLKYRLQVAGYTGRSPSPGDSLYNHHGSSFSTKDRANDAGSTANCAQRYKGAWWYTYGCSQCVSNLNGLYNINSRKGVIWYTWKARASLPAVRMMVKPR